MTNYLRSDDLSLKQLLITEEKAFSTSVQIGLYPRNFRVLYFEGARTPCSHYKNGRQELSGQCFAYNLWRKKMFQRSSHLWRIFLSSVHTHWEYSSIWNPRSLPGGLHGLFFFFALKVRYMKSWNKPTGNGIYFLSAYMTDKGFRPP